MKTQKAWAVYAKKEKNLTALVTGRPITIISPAIFRTRKLARTYINMMLVEYKNKVTIKRVLIKAI